MLGASLLKQSRPDLATSTAPDLAPNLVVIPVPRCQPHSLPPLQAALASPEQQQQLDGGLLESTPPPVAAHTHRQIHAVRPTSELRTTPARPWVKRR